MILSQEDAALFLKPCAALVTSRPTRVTTILGSCVAVAFHHSRTKWGAIFHALLPSAGHHLHEVNGDEVWRYVDSSVHRIDELLQSRSIPRQEVVVKLFGGAVMLGRDGRKISVGEQNSRVALEELRKRGYTIAAMDLGGVVGRKIIFFTATGEVLLKRLHSSMQ
ncbi:MAG: chemotaxis protein CheD [Desulfovibrionales bacterium]